MERVILNSKSSIGTTPAIAIGLLDPSVHWFSLLRSVEMGSWDILLTDGQYPLLRSFFDLEESGLELEG